MSRVYEAESLPASLNDSGITAWKDLIKYSQSFAMQPQDKIGDKLNELPNVHEGHW